MTEPAPGDREPAAPPAPPAPPAPHEPTMRVERPPTPGRAARAEMAAGGRPTPPFRPDEPTVTIPGAQPRPLQRTLEFGTPAPVKVTVGPRVKARRRYRTWPWIVAVVLALIALGVTLLVMLLRGQTIDGGTDVVGAPAGVLVSWTADCG
ncbi:MAG: hypothetical protein JWQ99_2170 [Blastococcus sp.]|jgi:hypothetical protein|nr:hypothetical protein [Blastococcus sp.]